MSLLHFKDAVFEESLLTLEQQLPSFLVTFGFFGKYNVPTVSNIFMRFGVLANVRNVFLLV